MAYPSVEATPKCGQNFGRESYSGFVAAGRFGKEMADRLTNLISIFENVELDFSKTAQKGMIFWAPGTAQCARECRPPAILLPGTYSVYFVNCNTQ